MTIRIARKYGFFASHRLHSHALSQEENRAIYGKCNNPYGHGHNYRIELTVKGEIDGVTGRAVSLDDLDRLVHDEILARFHHRNLNEEIEAFLSCVPTTENLASELDRRLRAGWENVFGKGGPFLERLCIWETERNVCELVADGENSEQETCRS